MRSRDYYSGFGMVLVDVIIIFSICIVLAEALWVSIVQPLFPKFWHIPQHMVIHLVVAVWMVLNGVIFTAAWFITNWKSVRAYNAWKATFEEDWRPRDSLVKRIVKATHLPGRQKWRDKDK